MRIGEREIGSEQPPYIIAELGVNHDGSAQRALELVRLAAEAGADAVKFQYFEADRLMSRAAKLAAYQKAAGESDPVEMLRRLELPLEAMQPCVTLAHDLGIHAIVTVFSVELVPLAERLAWDAYKSASPDLINRPLLEAMAATGKPLIVSTGASTLEECLRAARWLETAEDRLALLHCVSCYPTPPEQANPFGVQVLREVFPGPVGYSDHTTRIEFGRFMTGCGAVILEKHFTDDTARAGPDHAASLAPGDFARYAALARKAWKAHFEARVMIREMSGEMKARFEQEIPGGLDLIARGAFGLDASTLGIKPEKAVLGIEEDVRTVSRQSLTTTRDVPRGHVLARGDLTIKRPGTGIPPHQLGSVVGRTTSRPLRADMPITESDLL